MIDSESVAVEAFYINENKNWELKEHKEITDVISFVSLGFDLALTDIYQHVRFGTK
jgi:hypothetical protein